MKIKTHHERQLGVYTIFFALGAAVLFGFIGLAVDASRFLVVKAELQNATDACALGAVRELNGIPDALSRATGAGLFAANRNLKNFQSSQVQLTTDDIKFSETVVGPYSSLNNGPSFLSKYVQCTATEESFINFFLGIVGIENPIFSSKSIATLSSSSATCAIPMAICGNDADSINYGLTPNQKITLGASPSNGFFVWANVLGTSTLGNTEYSTPLTQYGTCNSKTVSGRCIGIHTGTISALDVAWNSRFGVYKSNATSPATAVPDLTGYGYRDGGSLASTSGALADYLANRLPTRAPFQSLLSGYVTSTNNTHNTYGASYRRLVTMPIVSCGSSTCGSGAKPLLGWACALMLAPKASNQNAEIQYLGRADDLNSLCRASGMPGGFNGSGPIVPVLIQ